jgi:uncharacterized protein YciI
VWSLVAVSIGQTTFAQSESVSAKVPESTTYWIFLTTGKGSQDVPRPERERMQAAHLANFRRLHEQGKLFTAGPMADPNKKLRGIVVVRAPDLTSLPELFKPDPYVNQGYMTLDAIRMEISVGEFQQNVDPKAIAEYRLVLLEESMPDGKEIDAESQNRNLEYWQSIHGSDRLCLAGWLRDDPHRRRGILIFRRIDDATLKSFVDEMPAVKSQTWKATTFPLYMTEGIVK